MVSSGHGSQATYKAYFSVIIGSGTEKAPGFENGALIEIQPTGAGDILGMRKVAKASREVCIG